MIFLNEKYRLKKMAWNVFKKYELTEEDYVEEKGTVCVVTFVLDRDDVQSQMPL